MVDVIPCVDILEVSGVRCQVSAFSTAAGLKSGRSGR